MYMAVVMQAFFALMMSGFGGGDLLDFMSTDSYWKAKHITVTVEQLLEDAKAPTAVGDVSKEIKDLASAEFKVRDAARKKIESMGPGVLPQLEPAINSKDDEVAEIAQDIQKKLLGRGKERAVRRLMAIRTLGERKEATAGAVLAEAAKSPDPFVADYAARSLALIDGQPLPVREPRKIENDVWLLPADVSVVGQVSATRVGKPITIDTVFEKYASALGNMGGPNRPAPDAEQIKKQRDQMLDTAYTGMLQVIDRLGNIRVDGATVGVSRNIGERGDGEKGWVVVIIRGTYDRTAAIGALKDMAGGGAEVREEDGTPAIKLGGGAMALMPSNDMLVFVAGPSEEESKVPADAVKAALKNGKKPLADAPLAARIKALQKDAGPAWALMEPNATMKKEATWIAPYSILTLTTKLDDKNRKLAYTITGEGADAEQVKASVEELQRHIKKGSDEIHRVAENMPAIKPLADIMDAIKIEADKIKAVMTGTLPTDLTELLGGMFPAMGGGMME